MTAPAPSRATFIALLSIIAGAAGTVAARAADANHGGELAQRWCAPCHIVSAEQKNGSTQAPPFSAIAKRPRFDQNRLAFFLLAPHPKMPDMALSRTEAADLAAYIATQKK